MENNELNEKNNIKNESKVCCKNIFNITTMVLSIVAIIMSIICMTRNTFSNKKFFQNNTCIRQEQHRNGSCMMRNEKGCCNMNNMNGKKMGGRRNYMNNKNFDGQTFKRPMDSDFDFNNFKNGNKYYWNKNNNDEKGFQYKNPVSKNENIAP